MSLKSHFITKGVFLLVIMTAVIVLCEGIAQFYVYTIAKKGKLYMPDANCGWVLIPNLNVKRINSNNQIWQITTDLNGCRENSTWNQEAAKKILILGDSFVFGEGINLSDRFDTHMQNLNKEFTFINLGVSGYGTDQELIGARRFTSDLKSGDILLIVTFFNDFFDILRKSCVGRAKPRFQLNNGELKLFPPHIGLKEKLRDKSYILSKIFVLLERRKESFNIEDFKYGVQLYSHIIINETSELRKRGAHVLIAFHGMQYLTENERKLIADVFNKLMNEPRIHYISLDDILAGDNQSDKHWSRNRHVAVGAYISKYLASMKK